MILAKSPRPSKSTVMQQVYQSQPAVKRVVYEVIYKSRDITSRQEKQPTRQRHTKQFHATFYGPTGHNTASGVYPIDGVTVAVDPKVIPLGTHIIIIMPDGTELHRIAQDTGSAVKGNIVDIFENSSDSVLLKKGRPPVKVIILKD